MNLDVGCYSCLSVVLLIPSYHKWPFQSAFSKCFVLTEERKGKKGF